MSIWKRLFSGKQEDESSSNRKPTIDHSPVEPTPQAPGKFRFPLIPDAEPRPKPKVMKEPTKTVRETPVQQRPVYDELEEPTERTNEAYTARRVPLQRTRDEEQQTAQVAKREPAPMRGRQRPQPQEPPKPSYEPPQERKPYVEREPQVKPQPQERRRPFRPTEVPSPVYGFQQRPIQEEEEEVEPLSEEVDIDEAWLNERVEVEREEAPHELEEVAAEWLQTEFLDEPIIVDEAELDEVVAEAEAIIEGEHDELEAPMMEVEVVVAEEPIIAEEAVALDEDTIEPLTFTNEEQPVVDRKRGPVPFNVMMLKEDRKKLAERKTSPPVQHTVEQPSHDGYQLPSLELLQPPVTHETDTAWVDHQTDLLNQALYDFNVAAQVKKANQGPTVTRFELELDAGVKVNKITNLADDLKLSLAALDIRIEAPIPGTNRVGIEVPNRKAKPVFLREILQHRSFQDATSPLTIALGLDLAGEPIVTDIHKMPHGLIAGATGSGKSVCINTLIVSILYRARPDEVKLLLIDPKMVELAPYNHIPHLVTPVINEPKTATAALKWAVEEMEARYQKFVHAGVRDIARFNEMAEKHKQYSDKMPYLVIIIDELADLMQVAPGEVEEYICRIAQKARACGIHLLLATQRPSVDVITGIIKANVPTRIAFSVSSQVDSRTILDTQGAERLLGRGDMLFLQYGAAKPVRLQGAFVSDHEIDQIVDFVKGQQAPHYIIEQDDLTKQATFQADEDELFAEACEFVVAQNSASASALQRRFRVGFNRAARLIEMMESQGIISEAKGTKGREVLITEEELESLMLD